MLYQKIVLAGGSGYLGKQLAEYFKDKAAEIIILSRREEKQSGTICYVKWDGCKEGNWSQSLAGADLLVNLCGKNVNCRYTEANKAEIIRSRVEPTDLLGRVIGEMDHPPKVWINLASATIYRHAEDHPQDEISGDIGRGFSIDVCNRWEQSFTGSVTPQTRKILLRVGIVLGTGDGALPRLLNLTRIGMGGHQGTGKQYVSWIHELDFARIVEWVTQNGSDGEIFNATAPGVVLNEELMRSIRKTLGIPIGISTPQWLLDLGARIIGTETELILKSRWVIPRRLLERGFVFQFPELPQAIHDLLSTRV